MKVNVLFTSDKEVSSTQGNTHSCYNGGMRECVNRMIDVRSCDILTACLMAILARLSLSAFCIETKYHSPFKLYCIPHPHTVHDCT